MEPHLGPEPPPRDSWWLVALPIVVSVVLWVGVWHVARIISAIRCIAGGE